MIFASGLGIVLSLVFGCLLLALIAELYYLLWWKKKLNTAANTTTQSKELFYLFRRREAATNQETNQEPLDVEVGPTKELILKPLENYNQEDAALVEAELMRLQNRLLFTIKEETKEDLESEDGRSKASRKGSRTRSLSDLILAVDPTTTTSLDHCYSHHGFNNPLFEFSLMEEELTRLRSSPPPKFKFLRDAEEKLYKKLLEERDLREGSFVRIVVGRNTSNQSSSQVLPLSSSPSSLTGSVHKKSSLDQVLSS